MLRFITFIGIAFVSVLGLAVALTALLLVTTPRPTDIRNCLTTKLFKVRLCPSEPGYVKLREISVHLRNAVLVSEDAAFYDHNGFDFHELQESVAKNWEKGEFARGGSTISQQLAKNVYLTSEKSLLRKVREALIVVQLEKELSKDEIFEKYLNVVEFGPEIYGIGKAARFYFKKSPSELTPAESAFLAFLLPSPKKYSVSFFKKQMSKFARSQTREIVNRMFRFKRLTEEEHAAGLSQLDYLFGGTPPSEATNEDILAETEELMTEDPSPQAEPASENDSEIPESEEG